MILLAFFASMAFLNFCGAHETDPVKQLLFLPGGTSREFALKPIRSLIHADNGAGKGENDKKPPHLIWIQADLPSQSFSDEEIRLWLSTLRAPISTAAVEFKELTTDFHAYVKHLGKMGSKVFAEFRCSPVLKPTPPNFIFLEDLGVGHEHDRVGYLHSKNPGLLIRSAPWVPNEILRTLIHELVHFQCDSKTKLTHLEKWLEEGLADFIAYRATGILPQRSITKYFNNPCVDTYYGSSFLWWWAFRQTVLTTKKTAGNESDKKSDPIMNSATFESTFIKILASLHLGDSGSPIHGSLAWNECRTDETRSSIFPHAEVLTASQVHELNLETARKQTNRLQTKSRNEAQKTPVPVPMTAPASIAVGFRLSPTGAVEFFDEGDARSTHFFIWSRHHSTLHRCKVE